MKEFIITWSIENISYSWNKTGEQLTSPKFFAGPMQNTAWNLLLYPRGRTNSDFLSLFLHREVDDVPIDIGINFELSCISADGLVLSSSLISETFITFQSGRNSGYGESRFLQRHELFGRRKALYLPQDVLTLRCRMWQDEVETNEFGHEFGRTRLTTEQIVSVENFNPNNEVNKTFHIKSKSEDKTLLLVDVLYYEDKLDLKINPSDQENMQFTTFKFSFIDKRTGNKLCELFSCYCGMPDKEEWRLPLSEKMLPTEDSHSDTRDFEMITELIYSTGEETEIIDDNYPLVHRNSEFLSNYITSCVPNGKLSDIPTISEDLRNLYHDQVLCDLEIRTQTTSFFVHKCVLCARSSVFSAMLTGQMKEKLNKCVEIEDISDVTLKLFLNFLYIESFEDLEWDVVIELYYAADKYQVERLKLFCCSHLLKNIDIDNVSELLILADTHHDCELKIKVKDFIWENEDQVFRSSVWKKFAYEQHQLAMQTMLSKYEEKETYFLLDTYEVQISLSPTIQDDFRFLYQCHIASDVVIKTGGATFPAHKTVLSASSSTFREMFRNDTIGKSLEVVKMEEWEDHTVSRMLFFLYTDSLEDTQWDTAIKLYQVAATYKIRRLQIKCSCFFFENVSVSNAADLLLVAHEHRDANLKSVVEDYILLHDEEIFGSDEWAAFSETHFRLAYETMRAKYRKNK